MFYHLSQLGRGGPLWHSLPYNSLSYNIRESLAPLINLNAFSINIFKYTVFMEIRCNVIIGLVF